MPVVAQFDADLQRKARQGVGRWHKIDLHNHTPTSFDYKYKGPDAVDRIAEQIVRNDLSVVMFTDHEQLPDQGLISALQDKTGRVLLRGVELNVFVDVFDKPAGKVSKEMFYHVLVGFDPDGKNSPDYWLEHLYRQCGREERQSGSATIRGITAAPERIAEELQDADALLIPAHLHTTRDPATSRSVDDIYDDPAFLRHAKDAFTALEVTDTKTAGFFDGKHPETGNLVKTCIRSSDSHEPSSLGWRSSWAQMETPSYRELKAALELPFRIGLTKPEPPRSHVIGMQIRGAFFPDQWVLFSPHCNVLIGVKGSGKTTVLECLRFALGADVPASRADSVGKHLSAVLGAGGTVRVLVKRSDGARILVERSWGGDGVFVVTFEDDRQERLGSAEGLLFPTHILGWHEIEQAATDVNIRRLYMDTIAGKAQIRALEEDAKAIATRIRDRHALTSQRYSVYRDLDRQVGRLKELRKGLQALTDANLTALRDSYQSATDQRQALVRAVERVERARTQARVQVAELLSGLESPLTAGGQSPLDTALRGADEAIATLAREVEGGVVALETALAAASQTLGTEQTKAEAAYSEFLTEYARQTAGLSPDQRRLLDSHREVLEQTKGLASLESEQAAIKHEVLGLLEELTKLCEDLANRLDERTKLRRESVDAMNAALVDQGVRLSVVPQGQAQEFQELSARYATGSRALQELRSKLPDRLAHLCLKRAYGTLSGAFDYEYGKLLFDSAELGYFLGVFENDDLRLELKVGKAGQEYSPIDQLSAGQRCTAIFPILLKLEEGALIVDQPEDNLDNRHIASFIGPALLRDKVRRQMMFTSHNANLVVLSDAEAILLFESDGTTGRIEEQGFFSTLKSPIARHVMDVLDGGDRALELRARKYGLVRRGR
jgi:energy-coupling factor transporter ATP-binding protein EcfA2